MHVSANELFISYSVANKAFVERLVADLEAGDRQVWVGHLNLKGGQDWPNTIEEAIDRSAVVLVVLSPESAESQYVRAEYGYAIAQHKRVVPLYLQECKVPMLLEPLHWIDFTGSYEQGLQKLLEALQPADGDTKAAVTLQSGSAFGRFSPLLLASIVLIMLIGLALITHHGAKTIMAHATPTVTAPTTATLPATADATSTITMTTMTAIAGLPGSATKTGSRATPTHAASSQQATPTNTPPATPTPTMIPSPTPSPTIRPAQ